jgi:hypothetical protein
MINFYFTDFVKIVLAFFLALNQSSVESSATETTVLDLGDQVDGMTLTTGAAEAPSLWGFCSFLLSNHVTTANCQVPQLPKLAIGNIFRIRDDVLHSTDSSTLTWNLYIDDKQVDLDDFDTYDDVLPKAAPSPSLVREDFIKFTAWDVVLTNLQPGVHTIEADIRSENKKYKWIVNLVIAHNSIFLEQA